MRHAPTYTAIAGHGPNTITTASANADEIVTSSTWVPRGTRIGRSSPNMTNAANNHSLASSSGNRPRQIIVAAIDPAPARTTSPAT